MALKDLLKATTYDRYTQDGRDKLNEALAEDVRYKTGDISQKTGLQKQPDGSWAPPKKGGAGKNVHGAEIDRIYEKHQNRIKELKAKGYTDEQIENDKIYQQTKEDMRNVGKKNESKPVEKKSPKEQYSQAIARRDELWGKKNLSEQEVKELQETNGTIQKLYKELTSGREPTPEAKKEMELREAAATGDPEKRKEFFAWQANKASDEEIDMVLSAKERGVNHPADFVEEFKKEKAKRSGNAEGKWQNSEALDFVHKLPPLNEAKTEQLFEAQDKLDEEWIAKKGNVDKERFEQAKALIKGELNKRGTTGKDYWAWKKTAGDSAPRVLTGDTKIRLRAATKDCGPRKITGDTKIKLKA